ncbi:hypothetical protein MVEN_02582800 [Mycena venus]|uniref:CxC1-like cysteine cluster associated with KDZ transposases domain-containing protein n=1 Tax=Mycena venus TaxID=2733690 RepID=A0A8H6WU42_9AGAR|nr:hypothetical protein MVEN_02582800 [Mycena venus]
MSKGRKPGLSGGHKVSYGRPSFTNRAVRIPINKTGAQIRQAHEQAKRRVAALSFVQQNALLGQGDHDIEMPDAPDYYSADRQDVDSDDEGALKQLPPGEEGYYHSHAGNEAVFQEIFEKCQPRRGDPRRRANRVQTTIDSWKEQMPYLVDAYLKLKTEGPVSSETTAGGWEIEVIGLDATTSPTRIMPGARMKPSSGMGTSVPAWKKVSLAFPIRLFEVFRQIHRICPRYSLSGLSTTLTNVHESLRRAPLAEQLSTAYDTYLEVIREVDARVHAALGRDAAWYIKNLCSTRLNNRASTSFRWLTPEQVDAFKDEVAKSTRPKKTTAATELQSAVPTAIPAPSKSMASTSAAMSTSVPTIPSLASTSDVSAPITSDVSGNDSPDLPSAPIADAEADNDDPDVAWLNVNELSGADSDELAKCLDTCVERWKAAGPEARKKMFALFAVSGIFLTVCRHGHVIVMCDMIRSGELMKYPLSMVKWLLDQYGADIGLGYDIMCAFFKTLMRSSLGARVTAMRMRGVVPAFHGHAHNRACQIGWHLLYVDGMGLEDFEESSCTRPATPFHCQQQINEHFKFHDEDKHAASGNFIYQNYRQALEKIAINSGQLLLLESSLGTTAADYEKYHANEVRYFQGLQKEPDDVQQTVEYIEKLQKHADASAASDQAKQDFQRLDYNIVNNGYTAPQITLVRTRYRTTYTKVLAIEEDLCRFEESHGITAGVLTTERRYRKALMEVERLVVQRLFELTKLGMSGLAYNLRDKIAKALKTRSEAIRRAITVYNEAAASLTPLRERLTFAETFVSSLGPSRHGVKPWSFISVSSAPKEEIRHLNVEITRLLTFLVDEHVHYYKAIAGNVIVNLPLTTELQKRWHHASRTSAAICKRIALTSRLVGFSGSIFPGQREDRDPDHGNGVPPPYWLAAELGVMQMSVEYEEVGELNTGLTPTSDDDDDSGLVVRELEVDEDHIVQLMDHLSTFDDS